jgi:hypothetical protein
MRSRGDARSAAQGRSPATSHQARRLEALAEAPKTTAAHARAATWKGKRWSRAKKARSAPVTAAPSVSSQ